MSACSQNEKDGFAAEWPVVEATQVTRLDEHVDCSSIETQTEKKDEDSVSFSSVSFVEFDDAQRQKFLMEIGLKASLITALLTSFPALGLFVSIFQLWSPLESHFDSLFSLG